MVDIEITNIEEQYDEEAGEATAYVVEYSTPQYSNTYRTDALPAEEFDRETAEEAVRDGASVLVPSASISVNFPTETESEEETEPATDRRSVVQYAVGLLASLGLIGGGGVVANLWGAGPLTNAASAPTDSPSPPADGAGGTDTAAEETATPTEAGTEQTATSTEAGTEQTATPTAADTDAAAYYDFEGEGTTIVDRSGNGHDGALRDAERAPGWNGQGVAFDRSAEAFSSLGEPGALVPGSDSYTISVRFRTTNASGAGDHNKQRLVAVRGSSNERVVLTLRGDQPRVTRSFSDGGYDPDVVAADSSVTHVDGEWHHAVIHRDMRAELLRLFVDGEQVDQTEVTQVEINPNAPVYLGAQPEYPNPRYYTGQIDDVRIYRAALSPDDIPS